MTAIGPEADADATAMIALFYSSAFEKQPGATAALRARMDPMRGTEHFELIYSLTAQAAMLLVQLAEASGKRPGVHIQELKESGTLFYLDPDYGPKDARPKNPHEEDGTDAS